MSSRKLAIVIGLAALVLCLCGLYIASTAPDGLEKVAQSLGFEEKARGVARYQPLTALLGAAIVFAVAWGIGKWLSSR